jgi:hypothetical protein
VREPQSKTIEGVEYVVTPLGASEGLKVITMLARMVGPVLGPALAGMKSLKDASQAIGGMVEQLNDNDIDAVCRAMAKSTVVKKSAKQQPQLSSIFDLHFQGEYFAMFLWLRFALEVNFESFFHKTQEALATADPESDPEPQKGSASAKAATAE